MSQVDPIDKHLPGCHRIATAEQMEQRTLPACHSASYPKGGAGRDLKIEIVQYRFIRIEAETCITQGDVRGDVGLGWCLQAGLGRIEVEQKTDPFHPH